MAELAAANAAKTAFSKSALENEILAENQGLDEDSTPAEAEAAIGVELTAQAGRIAGDADVDDVNFGTRSAAVLE